MALADLVSSLRTEAMQRRHRLLADAEEEALRIRARAEAEARRSRAESLARAEREELEAVRRSVSEARLEAAARVLAARARLLGRVRTALVDRIGGADRDPGYRSALARELAEALTRLPRGPVEARAGADLADELREAAAGHPAVRVVSVDGAPPGYTLRSCDGGVEIDATLSARMELLWPRIAVRVMREVDT